MSLVKLNRWLSAAKKNDRYTYHIGHLACDVKHNPKLQEIKEKLWNLAKTKTVLLFQRATKKWHPKGTLNAYEDIFETEYKVSKL